MLTRASNDALVLAHCPRTGLLLSFADVLETASLLAGRHDCGPTAAAWLAEALLGTALLGGSLAGPAQWVGLVLECDGPIESLKTELSGDGSLCGAPGVAGLGELDDREQEPSPEEVLGTRLRIGLGCGERPATTLWQTTIDRPAEPFEAILRACCEALADQPVAAALLHEVTDGRLGFAQGLMLRKGPGSRSGAGARAFDRARSLFEDGTVAASLDADASLDDLRALFGLPDLTIERTLRLAFGCRCSRAQVGEALAAPGTARELPPDGRPCRVRCPRCAEEYLFTRRELDALREPPPAAAGTETPP